MNSKAAALHLKSFSLRYSNLALGFFLLIDMLFILINVYAVLADLDKPEYDMLYVDSDRGLAEYFQYLKFTVLILASIYLILMKRYGYAFWGFLFMAMLLDDSSEYHETIGELIANHFNFEPWFGLRAVDWGELCYAAGFGIIMLAALVFFYRRGSRRFKNSCKDIGLLLILFVCFAVGLDMVHSLTLNNPPLSKVLALLEDGGEMLAISLVVWYFSFIIEKGDRERNYLYKIFMTK